MNQGQNMFYSFILERVTYDNREAAMAHFASKMK